MPKKLKRFLLRYEPPGLGFEVAEGEDIELVHKDLPPKAHVTTQEDVFVEVDRLIAEEELLTKKRHRPALIQLLGRLYQVDVNSGDEEDPETPPASKSKSSGPKALAEAGSQLQQGNTVVLVGLKADLAVHNGELGTLAKCRHDKKKYEVQMISSGEEVKVKGVEHLILVAPKGLWVGGAVVIRGLRNHTELNGCLGRVVESHEETHRYEVRAIESGQLFRVKQENLVPIDNSAIPALSKEAMQGSSATTPRKDKQPGVPAATDSTASLQAGVNEDVQADVFEAGCIVELQGLKTAMAYNGLQAEVLSVDRVRGRYEVRLSDNSVKTIRAENVRLISRPSKSSPRGARRKEGAGGGAKAADRGK